MSLSETDFNSLVENSLVVGDENATDKLPVELLEHIFMFCLPIWEPISAGVTANPSPSTAPLLLCQVCRKWREVTIGYPLLWSFLTVTGGSYTSKPSRPLIQIWLDHSANHPLTIHVYVDPWESTLMSDFEVLEDIFAMFLRELHRWREIELSVPDVALTKKHFPNAEVVAHRLTHFSAQFNEPRNKIPSLVPALLSRSPSLHHLTLKIRVFGGLDTLTGIPWANLVHLHLEYEMSVIDCLAIFTRSPKLECCHLENINRTETLLQGYESDYSIVMNRLDKLYISGEVNFIPFLRGITLPALEGLTIALTARRYMQCLPITDSMQFTEFLRRSNAPLRHLTLDNFQLPEDILVKSLTLIPGLTSLNINDLTDKVIRALSKRPDQSFICRDLTTLRLSGNLNSFEGFVSDMVEQRWKANAANNYVASLKNVHVEFTPDITSRHDKDVQVLRRLRSEGLITQIFY